MKESILLLSAPWAWFLGGKLADLYRERGILKPNYRGAEITPALGPAILLGYLPSLGLAGYLDCTRVPQVITIAAVLLGVSLFGLWDDLLADSVSGFRGHLGALVQGKITAGLLKMVLAGTVGLIFSLALPFPIGGKILAATLTALSANGLNLLDRRPGRALKVFFAGSGALILAAGPANILWLLLPLSAVALAVAPLDFGARAMLGDCGANLLGAALGVAAVYCLPFIPQLAIAIFWAAVHVYSEIYSISRFIERHPLLKYLDGLGCNHE